MVKHGSRPRAHLITQSIALVFLLVGAVIALYPLYVGSLNDVLDNYRLQKNEAVSQKSAASRMATMVKENERLKRVGLNANADPFSGLSKHERAKLKKDQIGSVTVPKLKLTVPLFQTLSEQSLAIGAAVVPGTSMPIGGRGTHTVIAGHRGLVDRRLFSDLNRVHRGDVFVLKVLHRHLAYRVFKIQTVLPDDTSVLQIEQGRDLATLLTCTPYMVNSHRLLITGKRVPYTKTIAKAVNDSKVEEKWEQLGIFLGASLLLLTLIGLIGRYIYHLLMRRHHFTLIFYRQDQNGQPLAKASYQLCNSKGKPLYRNGELFRVASDHDGQVLISDLPGGKYVIKELQPAKKLVVVAGTRRLKQQKMQLYPTRRQKSYIRNANNRWMIRH
jgi:sortase A